MTCSNNLRRHACPTEILDQLSIARTRTSGTQMVVALSLHMGYQPSANNRIFLLLLYFFFETFLIVFAFFFEKVSIAKPATL